MAEKMSEEQINKIAQAIAAKLAEPGGNQLLGCGSASSTQQYSCRPNYICSGSGYECGGNTPFNCGGSGSGAFSCVTSFACKVPFSQFDCTHQFDCSGSYIR